MKACPAVMFFVRTPLQVYYGVDDDALDFCSVEYGPTITDG